MLQHLDWLRPTDSETHLVYMLQHLDWLSLEDRRKDAGLVMMYEITSENVVIAKTDRLKPPLRQLQNIHSSSFIIPPCKTRQRQALFPLERYMTGTGCHSP